MITNYKLSNDKNIFTLLRYKYNENIEISVEEAENPNTEDYNFTDYYEYAAIIVDDRGVERKSNPVFDVVSNYRDANQLAAN